MDKETIQLRLKMLAKKANAMRAAQKEFFKSGNTVGKDARRALIQEAKDKEGEFDAFMNQLKYEGLI